MLLEALKKKLEGEVAVAEANIHVYLNKAVGIGEHPDIVEALETQFDKLTHAQDKLDMVNGYL